MSGELMQISVRIDGNALLASRLFRILPGESDRPTPRVREPGFNVLDVKFLYRDPALVWTLDLHSRCPAALISSMEPVQHGYFMVSCFES